MKPLDVLTILFLLIVGNCNCIYLKKNRHLKGTNEKKKKTETENTQNRALTHKVPKRKKVQNEEIQLLREKSSVHTINFGLKKTSSPKIKRF